MSIQHKRKRESFYSDCHLKTAALVSIEAIEVIICLTWEDGIATSQLSVKFQSMKLPAECL